MIVLFTILALLLGLAYGLSGLELPLLTFFSQHTDLVLYLLMFSVGISVGMHRGLFRKIREYHIRIFIIPFGIILGSLVGGVVCACRWPARKLLGGLAAGLTCGVLLWIISAARGGGQVLEVRGLVVLTSCLCGGALAGLLCLRFGRKKPSSVRRSRM